MTTGHPTPHQAQPAPAPPLPRARGELTEAVLPVLTGHPGPLPGDQRIQTADPYGEDLQLLLYTLYELHYRGFAGVDDRLEWEPALLTVRAAAERAFLAALRDNSDTGSADVGAAVAELATEPTRDDGQDVSRFLQRTGDLAQLRDYAALRSLYHLKEADPHLWVVPRLRGRAKAAMVAVEFDEFGAGRGEDIHAELFARLLTALGLSPRYGWYVDAAPATALATVNLMSLFGLHRRLRGALVGHFATVEITSSPASRRLAAAMRRAGAGPDAARFYDEHVTADAVHEQVVRRDVLGGLLAEEPDLAPDIVFGVTATQHLEDRLARHLLTHWRAGRSALRPTTHS